MKLKSLFAIVSLTAALGVSLVVTSADAQGRRGGGRNSAQNNDPNGPGGANQPGVNPTQVQMMMSLNNSIVDPAVSAKFTLVFRDDVQNALSLDLKQKNALEALKAVQTQNQQKVNQDLRSLVQSTRGPGQNTTTADPPPTAQDLTAKLQGVSLGYQTDLDKHVDEILTPTQRKRLTEIDLRWRGPLSLIDSKVAEQAAVLGTDDKKKVQDSYKEFTDARQKLVNAMMPAGRTRGNTPATAASTTTTSDAVDAGAASTQPAAPMTPAERQAAQRQARIDFDKSCSAMVTKLLANVSPATAAAWKEMLGAPFTFRDIGN